MKLTNFISFVLILSILGFTAALHAQNKSADMAAKLLHQMESPAEDMLDAIVAKDFKKINKLFLELKQKMQELNQLNKKQQNFSILTEAQTKELAIENSWFSLITLELKEMDDLPALSYAVNQFSGELVIMTPFEHLYQKDTAWMDYLGSDLLLLSKNEKNANPDLITIRKTELQKTWMRVRMTLMKNKQNKSLVMKIDDLINHLMQETDNKKLGSMAQKELELVDEIENALQIK